MEAWKHIFSIRPKNAFQEQDPKEKYEILFEGEYYDVTNWIPRHPGGNIIKFYTEKGEDSTHAIQQFHHREMDKVRKILKSMKKRAPTKDDVTMTKEEQKRYDSLTEDYHKIYKEALDENLFEPDYAHIFMRLAEVLGLGTLGIYLFIFGNHFILNTILPTLLFGISGVRAAFLSHEYGHRSMTGVRKIEQVIQSFLMGSLVGLSAHWWNSQHNRHHAMPQRFERDVDLDTLPLIAFNSKVVRDPKKEYNFLVKNQSILFFSIDTFLVLIFWRLFLCPRYCFHKGLYMDLFFMGLGYTIPLITGWPTFIVISWIASIFVFGTFTMNHTHLPVTTEPKHWVEFTLHHTANVNYTRLVNYAMGHLNYQIEHHLYPQMPQLNCRKIQNRVKAMAAKHNIPYLSNSYFDAIKLSLENLQNVSNELEGKVQ